MRTQEERARAAVLKWLKRKYERIRSEADKTRNYHDRVVINSCACQVEAIYDRLCEQRNKLEAFRNGGG